MSNPSPNYSTRFKPGQSGNPGGKRPGLSITSKVRDILEGGSDALVENAADTNVIKLAKTIVIKAILGDMKAIGEVWDRVDGKVASKVEHAGQVTVADAILAVEQSMGIVPGE